jgi:hypothetical protein
VDLVNTMIAACVSVRLGGAALLQAAFRLNAGMREMTVVTRMRPAVGVPAAGGLSRAWG